MSSQIIHEIITAINTSTSPLVLPATLVTIQRFTRCKWAGGILQTRLMSTLGPRLGCNLRLVGDSMFPEHSSATMTLAGVHVRQTALREMGILDSIAFSCRATKVDV